MKKSLAVITVLIVIILLPFLINREPFSPDQLRERYNSNSIELSQGVTEYESIGRGDTALLFIHGFSIPHFIWDGQMKYFSDRNWRTICYNQYGRGYSDYPDINYDRSDYIQQARELLDSLQVKKVILVGHSMGGALAAEISAAESDRVIQVILVDPMLDEVTDNTGAKIARTGVVGEWLTRLILGRAIEKRAYSLLQEVNVSKEGTLGAKMKVQRHTKGFHRSLYRVFRGDAMENYRSSYEILESRKIPTLILYGDQEERVNPENMETILKALPSAVSLHLAGASHIIHLQYPEVVNRAIEGFIAPAKDE